MARKPPTTPCSYAGCTGMVRAGGLCPGHLAQLARGVSLRPLHERKRPNAHRTVDEATVAVLWRGHEVLIDGADLDLVLTHRWHVNHHGYVVTGTPNGAPMSLHRFLLDPPSGMVVDHIDGNPLNNRRANIRVCTTRDNAWNQRRPARHGSSGHLNVNPWRGRYRVTVGRVHVGIYDQLEDALDARDNFRATSTPSIGVIPRP